MSDSLWPHGSQHTRLPCPSLSPRVCSNSRALSQWCHPTISSSVTPFSYPQSFRASGSFPMSRVFASGGHSIGVSASASVLPMNIQDWFLLGLTGLISFRSKELSSIFSRITVQKYQFFNAQPFLWSFWSFFQQAESITNWYSITLLYLLLMDSQAKEWHIRCAH